MLNKNSIWSQIFTTPWTPNPTEKESKKTKILKLLVMEGTIKSWAHKWMM